MTNEQIAQKIDRAFEKDFIVTEITITESDLKAGVRDNCLQCVVALAINRHLDRDFGIYSSVGTSHIAICASGLCLHDLDVAPEVEDIIHYFDEHGTLPEWMRSFSIELPKGCLSL